MDTETLAEFVVGRPDRMDGAGLRLVRDALGLWPDELAARLESTEREIDKLERERKALIPERLDLGLRKLFLSR